MNDGEALKPDRAKALLVKILTEDGIVEIRPHARKEMANDQILEAEVMEVLRGGAVEPAEWENKEWRYGCDARRPLWLSPFSLRRTRRS
jgi:hypothetical protein